MAFGIRLGGAYIDYGARTAGFDAGARRVRGELSKQRRSFGRFQSRMRSVRRDAAALGTQFISLRGALAGLGVAGAGGAVGLAVRSIAGLEDRLAAVKAVSRASAEGFGELTAQARLLGRTTRFTGADAAEGQLLLARAGFRVKEIISALPGTLRLAQVGELDMGEAALFASNTIRQFGLSAEATTRVVDVLARGSSASNTDVRQLADGLKLVAPAAVSLGLDLETTVAALGKLADAGLQATLGGTGLRQVLFKLAAPSDEAKRILAGLGVTAEDVAFRVHGLSGVLQNLRDSGLSAEQAIEVFGARGQPAFANLVKSIPQLRALEDQLRTSAGAADQMATIMDDTLVGAALRTVSAIAGFVDKLGDVSGGTRGLKDLLDDLAEAINGWTDNLETGFARARQAAELLFGVFVAWRFAPVLAGMAAAVGQAGLLGAGLTAARTAALALIGVLRTLGRLAVVFALVEGVILIIDAWEGLSRAIGRMTEDWRTWAVLAIDGVQRVFETLLSLPGVVLKAIQIAWDSFIGFVSRIPDAIAAAFAGESISDGLFGDFTERMREAWAELGEAANAVDLPDIAGAIFGDDVAARSRKTYALAGSEAGVAFMNSLRRRIEELRGSGGDAAIAAAVGGGGGGASISAAGLSGGARGVGTAIELANLGGGRGNEFISEYHLSLMREGVIEAQRLGGAFQAAKDIAVDFGQGLAGVFADVLTGIRSLGDGLKALASQIASAFFQKQFANIIGHYVPGLLAEGGPAQAGRPYIVGEEGPELFIPSQSGRVVANAGAASRGAFPGAGQGDVNITYAPVIQGGDEASVLRALAKAYPEFRDQVLAEVGINLGRPSLLRSRVRG